jgi:hypothetical protein
MVDVPREASRRVLAALYPSLVPALRHAGWFAVFLMLAPVIGPRGYGLFIVALSGVAIVEGLWAATLSGALTGVAALDARHWSTALVTAIAGGGALWAALYTLTGPLSMLLGEPASSDLLQSLAILPLLGGLAAVPGAALRREGRETPLVAASLAGFAAGGGIAVSLAWSGAGPWSLAAQIIVWRLVECVVLWGIPGERVGLEWSRRHFAELTGAVRWRSLVADDGQLLFYATSLAVGLVLGPSAAGLYVLAVRPAAALADLALAQAAPETSREALRPVWRLAFPAVLASTLMAVALPPLVDLRWWGAVFPAQILALGAIPAVLCGAAAPLDRSRQTLGGIAVAVLAAGYGLAAIAGASLAWTALCAAAGLPVICRRLDREWRAALRDAARPAAGAALAGLALLALTGPVSLNLATVPTLCLLIATGWLIYLIVRGDAAGAGHAQPVFAPAMAAPMPPESGD